MPILAQPASRKRIWAHLGGSVVLAVAAAIVLAVGCGDVHSALALHGPKLALIDAALLAGAAYGVLRAVGMLMAAEALPYRPGIYLFPACAVDAEQPALKVWQVRDAERIETITESPPGLALWMPRGERFVIRASSPQVAERAHAVLQKQRAKLIAALDDGDSHVLADLDPLYDRALSSPIGPTESLTPTQWVWRRFDWAIAAGVGVMLALVLVTTRNSISDDAMIRAVVTEGSPQGFREYLARGGHHAYEVESSLLPRAELAVATRQQSVEALRDFERAHPSSKVQPEVDLAMRRAFLADLSAASQAGTVTALDAFAKTHPEPYVTAEWTAARHALFTQALTNWRTTAKPDAATSLFMERLLAWTEKNGPACELRFQLNPSASLDQADAGVRRSGHFPGNDALPSNFLTPDALRGREERVADALVKRFAAAFPSDIVSLTASASASAGPPPPGLVVAYTADWSHATTACTKPDTAFAGFIFTFDATFVLPDGRPPLSMISKAWRGAEAWRIRPDGRSREEFEQKVYDAMIDGAFDQVEKKLTNAFL
jgi:hypothetical protein